MSVDVNIHEAKTHLSRLLEKALAGKDVVIRKAGKPLVRLTPVATAPTRRKIGTAKDDFECPKISTLLYPITYSMSLKRESAHRYSRVSVGDQRGFPALEKAPRALAGRKQRTIPELRQCVGDVDQSGTGQVPIPTPHSGYIFKQMDNNRLAYLGIRPAHFMELESLPPLYRDPFDRMLVAQARAERMSLATVDSLLRRYGVKVV